MKSILKTIIHVLKHIQKIFFNVLLQNITRMEHFEVCLLKLILKLLYRKLMDQLK